MGILKLFLTVLVLTLRFLCRSRYDLILENLALRQQLGVLTRTKHRPRPKAEMTSLMAMHNLLPCPTRNR